MDIGEKLYFNEIMDLDFLNFLKRYHLSEIDDKNVIYSNSLTQDFLLKIFNQRVLIVNESEQFPRSYILNTKDLTHIVFYNIYDITKYGKEIQKTLRYTTGLYFSVLKELDNVYVTEMLSYKPNSLHISWAFPLNTFMIEREEIGVDYFNFFFHNVFTELALIFEEIIKAAVKYHHDNYGKGPMIRREYIQKVENQLNQHLKSRFNKRFSNPQPALPLPTSPQMNTEI